MPGTSSCRKVRRDAFALGVLTNHWFPLSKALLNPAFLRGVRWGGVRVTSRLFLSQFLDGKRRS